ncbi:unnamed protein product [Ranitomeya imitator]|uniref:Uncharacterized protein n=1 Tax=Ranitomeya imitator TaxID=111125 RepID=A0ABN9L6B9_9NEOB|nr:unnamed protein product [Ranitomeya imitator]
METEEETPAAESDEIPTNDHSDPAAKAPMDHLNTVKSKSAGTSIGMQIVNLGYRHTVQFSSLRREAFALSAQDLETALLGCAFKLSGWGRPSNVKARAIPYSDPLECCLPLLGEKDLGMIEERDRFTKQKCQR